MSALRALLVVGSAKPAGTSSSEALGSYLLARLADGGAETTVLAVSRSAAGDDGHLAAAVAEADLFILATPLYVDSLPFLVTRAIEHLAAARKGATPRRRAMVAIVNCGFPEPRQCETALDILRLFARRTGFEWAGGLALGEGGAIDGHPLEARGGMTRHVRAALDLAAAALLRGEPVPEEAVTRFGRPLMPEMVYTMIGNVGWKRQARRHGVRWRLAARPFDD